MCCCEMIIVVVATRSFEVDSGHNMDEVVNLAKILRSAVDVKYGEVQAPRTAHDPDNAALLKLFATGRTPLPPR